MLAILGPLEFRAIQQCAWISGPSVTALRNALAALVGLGLVDATERSDIAVIDGMRCRRDFMVYSLVRPAGGER